jgi:HTH-type transcriptional regulator / antitoxin HigA
MAAPTSELHPLGDTDYAIPPGETLRELLDEQGLTQRELARRTGLSPKHVNRLLQGLVPLSTDVAQRLERVTGAPARIWNRLEANYQSDLQRLRDRRDLAAAGPWLAEQPVRALIQRGVLPEEPSDKISRVEQMLNFFGVASVDAWDEVYKGLACSFRQSKAYEVQAGSVAAWLRLGEIAARDVQCSHSTPLGCVLRSLGCERLPASRPRYSARSCGTFAQAMVLLSCSSKRSLEQGQAALPAGSPPSRR